MEQQFQGAPPREETWKVYEWTEGREARIALSRELARSEGRRMFRAGAIAFAVVGVPALLFCGIELQLGFWVLHVVVVLLGVALLLVGLWFLSLPPTKVEGENSSYRLEGPVLLEQGKSGQWSYDNRTWMLESCHCIPLGECAVLEVSVTMSPVDGMQAGPQPARAVFHLTVPPEAAAGDALLHWAGADTTPSPDVPVLESKSSRPHVIWPLRPRLQPAGTRPTRQQWTSIGFLLGGMAVVITHDILFRVQLASQTTIGLFHQMLNLVIILVAVGLQRILFGDHRKLRPSGPRLLVKGPSK